ncbi:ankyrin repeat domain-containing protein 26 isoform X2 [Corythoichthys intestinalis]|uniref:ankyrin repeat domain-containing protein 26 isoform X2 n=1 Tax=Corythoichthys intestinalis TaxID=161448 RepID=UPI0025A65D3A|nr:ankyrin repeat domain-containing protein 26 isoform X2 [Corythoichthys intestinalis]
MKKLFSFSKKKQSPSRTPDRGNALSIGYDVKEKDLGKFHKAAWRGDVAKLEHLAKTSDVNQVDKHNRTALHLACACGNVEVVRFLVEKNVKLNLRDNQNRSALIKAVQGQHDLCTSILLENHADPNLVETEGNTALHLASSIPSISTAETLLEHDADVNAQNKEGISPLAVAVQEGHLEMAEYLLKKGADVNMLDRDHRSPLMIAACSGQISMVRILLQFHADITLKDNKGQSAEDYAVIEGHHPCALLITEHGTQMEQATLSHPGPSKKKSKSETGNAPRPLLSGFSVGGPATDKDVFEDNSQAESLSRLSKKGGTDEWGSSEDDCESLEIEKTPPKMNLRKMLESKRGKAKHQSEPAAGKRGPVEQLSGSQSSSESQAQSSEGEGSEEEEDEEAENEDDVTEEEEEIEESEEESENDSYLVSVQSNTSSSEDAQKSVEVDFHDGTAQNKQSSDHDLSRNNAVEPLENYPQASGGSHSQMLRSLDMDQDLVVSAVRVESKYSDEDDEFMSESGQKTNLVKADLVKVDPQISQVNVLAEGENMDGETDTEDDGFKNEMRRSSWGSSLEETTNKRLAEEGDVTSKTLDPQGSKATLQGHTGSLPKPTKDKQATKEIPQTHSARSKNRTSAADSDWDSPSEKNTRVTTREQSFKGSSPESQNKNTSRKQSQHSKSLNSLPTEENEFEASEKKDSVDLKKNPSSPSSFIRSKIQTPSIKLVEENCSKLAKACIKFIKHGGRTSQLDKATNLHSEKSSHKLSKERVPSSEIDVAGVLSDGSVFSEPLPHTDIDDVDLDSPDEKEDDEIDESDESSDGDTDDEDYDDQEEEDEEEISDDQLEDSRDLLDGATDVPEKADVSKDTKTAVYQELGLENKEQKSGDSEHEDHNCPHEDEPINQEQNTTGEEIKEDLLSIPSFLRGAGRGWMPEPWWSRGRLKGLGTASPLAEIKGNVQKEDTTQKENENTKWGLLLSECEGKSKEKTDLMEELGLGDFDYAEDASDWDTSSDASKKSLPEGTKTPPAPEELPRSSSMEKDVNISPKAPVAPPRRFGGDEKKVPHPQPRSKKTMPQESDKSDWDQETASICSEAKSDDQQLQEEIGEGTPEVSPMAADIENHLQTDKEKDETLESCDFEPSHPRTSLPGNIIRDQQSPEERLDDDVQPDINYENLWEEVEPKEAKGQIPSESGKQMDSSSGEEQSSDEEEAEAKKGKSVDFASHRKLKIDEHEKNLEEHTQPCWSSRYSASLPVVTHDDCHVDGEKLNQEVQKEIVNETPEADVSVKNLRAFSDTDGSATEGVAVEKLETGSTCQDETSNQAEASQQAQKTEKPLTSESHMTQTGVSKPREQAEEKTVQLAGNSKARASRTPHIDNTELSLFDDSTLSDVSDDEGRCQTGELRKKQQSDEMEMSEDLGDLNSSSDVTTDDSDFHASGHRCSSLFIQNLDSITTDSRSMVKLQNIFHKYERSIQKAKSRHSYYADKVSILETEKTQLKCSLDEVKNVKSALERNQLDLQTEVTNLKFQLKQEQENGRNATMMYNTTGDKLKRTEEQRLLEVQEKQKVELSLRNLELEMRILVSNKKQLEEDNSQTQMLLAQERSARTVLENLLNSHVRKQQEIEEENKRNIGKSNEALSQLTEAGDRERELLQQISIFHEQLSTLRTDLESSQANSSIKQRDLQEENKSLKEQLEEARRALKVNSDTLNQSVLDFNNQTATMKSELTVAATRLENERGVRETMAAELESVRARLTVALQEAERSMAARSDAEKALLQEKEEHRRLQDRLSNDASSQHEAVSSLSQKLSKAEAHANSIENDAHCVKLQLTEKNLLLNTLQRENDQINARVKELEAALLAEKEQVTRAAARQEATLERLAQMQSESMLVRQQLEEAQNKGVAKENAVTDAQKSFSNILSELRKDCEDRVQLAQDRYQDLDAKAAELRENIHQLQEEKSEREANQRQLQQELADSLKKLSMCEASLEVNTRYRNDLEDEKTRLHKDMDSLKSKMDERESQCLEVEKHVNKLRCHLDEREKELCAAAQKQQEALSAAAASEAVVKQLEETIQRLEIENVKLEAAAKQQANKLEALQKDTQEEKKVRAHLEDLVTNLQSSKMTLEEELSKEVQKQSMLSNSAHDSQALWEEELKSRSKLGLRLAELEKEKGELDSQVEIERRKAKKVSEQKKAVDSRLEQEMERNTELQKEIYRLRTLLKTAKRRMREMGNGGGGDFASPMSSLKVDLGRNSRADGAFNGRAEKVRDLQGELERSAFQGSLSERRLLEEEVQSLKRRVEASEAEQRQMEQYRREVEEKARQELHHKLQEVNIFLQSQAATQEAQDQIKAANEASLRLKIQELESELNRARTVQHDTLSQKELTRTELEHFKELYREEQRLRKSLSSDLKRTNHQLTEASSRFVNERSKSLIASPGTLPPPSVVTGSLGAPYRSLGSGLLGTVTEGQSSSMEDYLARMQRQLDRSISRELNKASAELDISLARMSPVGSASRVELDPVSRAKQQYLEVLKKNHEV